ncbi:MAG TPA: riboflavin kinase, partial [Chitinophagaceae bacterium]
NIGRRPTFNEKELRIEVNIFDFDEEIYGENMTIRFIDFIRRDEKFDTVPALIAQMGQDKLDALRILVD